MTIFTLSLHYWLVYRYNDITLTTDGVNQRAATIFIEPVYPHSRQHY